MFDIIPKLGSFEVSTVIKVNGLEAEILIFSKMLQNSWPNLTTLQKKLQKFVSDVRQAQRGESMWTAKEIQAIYQTAKKPIETKREERRAVTMNETVTTIPT